MPDGATTECALNSPHVYLVRILLATLVLIGLVAALESVAYADEPALPRDYTEETHGNQYIFVMLARDGWSDHSEMGQIVKDEAIRSKYSQSGLYRNDDSTAPLWTVDWYAFSVEVSSDGHHLVKYGPWPGRFQYGEVALTFYLDGREVKSYNVSDLVTIPPLLPSSVSHYMWLDDSSFDDESGRLRVQTRSWDSYVFDVTTGDVVEGVYLPGLPKCLAPLMAVAMIWLTLRFRRRSNRPQQPKGESTT